MFVNNKELIGRFTPTPYIEEIKIESKDSESIKTSLRIVVKDRLNENLTSQWFGNEDISDLVNLSIMQVSDKRAFEYLSRNNYYELKLSAYNPSLFVQKFLSWVNENAIDEEDSRKLSRSIFNESISLRDPESHNDGFYGRFTETAVDGVQYENFNFGKSFDLEVLEPDFLAYLCYSYISPEEFLSRFGVSISQEQVINLFGKVNADYVFRDKVLAVNTNIYIDQNGNIWSGSVHVMEDGTWMTGATHDNNSTPVTLRTVPNVKIKDYRNLLKPIDLRAFESVKYQDQSKPKILRNDETDVQKGLSYFTNLWNSRGEENNSKLLFGINIHNILKEKSNFSKILDISSDSTVGTILNLTAIKEIKFFRRRIKTNPSQNYLGSDMPRDRFEDLQESDLLMFQTGDTVDGFVDVSNSLCDATEDNNYKLPQTKFSNSSRFFQVVDKNLKNLTFGKYQYGIEVTIEDGVNLYLQNLYLELVEQEKNLVSYMQRANLGYDYRTQRFNQQFIEKESSFYSQDNYLESPWIKSISRFAKGYKALITEEEDNPVAYLMILNMICPEHGNLEALEFFVKEYKKLIFTYENLLEKTSNLRTSSGLLKTKAEGKSYSFGSSTRTNILRVEHFFKNTLVDAEDYSDSGISYFTSRTDNFMPTITTEEFFSRVSFENEKRNEDQVISEFIDQIPYSAFSPSFIQIEDNKRYDGLQIENPDSALDLLNLNFPNLLESSGVTITNAKLPDSIPLVFQQSSLNESLQSINTDNRIDRAVDLEINLINEKVSNLESNQSVVNTIGAELLKGLAPVQIRTASPTSDAGLNTSVKIQTTATKEELGEKIKEVGFDYSWIMNINWSLIKKIEVLSDLITSDNNDKLIRGEIWTELTEESYTSLSSRNSFLLCRMVPYSNQRININYNNKLDLPTYNKYFILQTPNRINRDVGVNADVQILSERIGQELADRYAESRSIQAAYTTVANYSGRY